MLAVRRGNTLRELVIEGLKRIVENHGGPADSGLVRTKEEAEIATIADPVVFPSLDNVNSSVLPGGAAALVSCRGGLGKKSQVFFWKKAHKKLTNLAAMKLISKHAVLALASSILLLLGLADTPAKFDPLSSKVTTDHNTSISRFRAPCTTPCEDL